MSELSAHGILYPRQRIFRVLVLPHSDDSPPGFTRQTVRLTVTILIPLQLRRPIVHVRAWGVPVERAPVPEAAIHEHRDPTADPDNVRAPANVREWQAPIHSVPPYARAPQGLTQTKLRARVPTSRHSLHPSPGVL